MSEAYYGYLQNIGFLAVILHKDKKNPAFETPDPEMNYCNCSVPSQLRCKIHSKSASPMGFCITESFSYGLGSKCFDLY